MFLIPLRCWQGNGSPPPCPPPFLWDYFIWHQNQSCCETRIHGKPENRIPLTAHLVFVYCVDEEVFHGCETRGDKFIPAPSTTISDIPRQSHHIRWPCLLFCVSLSHTVWYGSCSIWYLQLSKSKDRCRSGTSSKCTNCWVEQVGHLVSSLVCIDKVSLHMFVTAWLSTTV